MRNQEWLDERFSQLWIKLFPEVEKANNVIVRFKGRWKNKFGHIKKIGKDTEICINGLFRDERIPLYIIDLTLAHELIHYMHGFNSPLERKHRHPHKGGIVTKELIRKGFRPIIQLEKQWIKNEWLPLYREITSSQESW